ncbi:isochorismatase family protein [Brumicola blandensis]|uniref:Isochorismatase family protein n=1 Tax=Brumicola blandensis TaxID=3075611 RepID=A0AAW8QZ27_9ALTE|nr:isochorismatase family protein [Alteromonas sp. W409]MDT0582039.1 isochorismatase family protein [Alteromonas sp. W409]
MLQPESTGVIFVDIQGKLAELIEQAEPFISNTVALFKGAQDLHMKTLVLEQMPDKLGHTASALSDCFSSEQQIIAKHHFNACHEAEFVTQLQDPSISDWLVCGIEAHICVYQTITGLLESDLATPRSIHLVCDAIGSRNLNNKAIAIQKLNALGVQLSSTEMCLYELLKDAQNPAFKRILSYIK